MRARRMRATVVAASCCCSCGMPLEERHALRETVREMIYHTYDGYMRYAFPHDELRPLSQTHTDSLVELGAATPTRKG